MRLTGNSQDGRMPICAAVPVVIREERLARGISQYDMARDSGFSREMLRLVENGSSVPTVETLARICEVLKMQMRRRGRHGGASGLPVWRRGGNAVASVFPARQEGRAT